MRNPGYAIFSAIQYAISMKFAGIIVSMNTISNMQIWSPWIPVAMVTAVSLATEPIWLANGLHGNRPIEIDIF